MGNNAVTTTSRKQVRGQTTGRRSEHYSENKRAHYGLHVQPLESKSMVMQSI